MKYALILFFLMLSFKTVSKDIDININGLDYTFNAEPTWVELVQPFIKHTKWYWPASQAFYASMANSDDLIKQIHKDLLDINASNPLTQCLASLEIGERIKFNADYNRARLISFDNAVFSSDKRGYVIRLNERAKSVILLGAISKTTEVKTSINATAKDYIAQVNISKNAVSDRAWILSPSGEISLTHIGIHNNEQQTVMPGSVLFIPFKDSLFKFSRHKLNENIVSLLPHVMNIQECIE